jgi:lipopolysaccharide export system permease protein
MTLDELRKAILAHPKNDLTLNNLVLELHSRFAMPISCFMFALIGVPLGIQNRRSGKAGGFSLSIVILLAFYLVLSVTKNLGEKGIVNPAVAAWLPNFIFLVVGFAIFRLAAHEVSIPVFEVISDLVARLKAKFRRGRTP